MEFKVTDFNIVVLASAHNPSILNPDFLKNNGIVDKDIKPIEVICTPPFSQVKFEDKTSIFVDTERLTFADSEPDRLPSKTGIPQMAIKYLDVLTHVPYTAVGINFNCFFEFSHMPPTRFIMNRFINKEIWNEFDDKSVLGLKFSLNNTTPVVHNIEINPGMILNKKAGKQFPIVAIKSNFHCIPQGKVSDDLRNYIGNWMTYFESLKKTLERFFF